MSIFSFSKIRHISISKVEVATTHEIALHQLISKQEWNKVELFLTDPSKSKHFANLSLSSTVTITEHYLILHYACQFDASLQTILKISATYPSSLTTAGHNGRYPLHVAAANGCDPDVIRFFLCTMSSLAGVQDNFLKTPLHYTREYFKNYCDNHFGCTGSDFMHQNMLKVVELL